MAREKNSGLLWQARQRGPERNDSASWWPHLMQVRDVMTESVFTMHADALVEEGLKILNDHDFRHLPLVDDSGKPVGMVSIRGLFRDFVSKLKDDNATLIAYLGADGAGG